jgi:hypothetical protein
MRAQYVQLRRTTKRNEETLDERVDIADKPCERE